MKYWWLLLPLLLVPLLGAGDPLGAAAWRQLKFLLTDLTCDAQGTCDLAAGTTIGGAAIGGGGGGDSVLVDGSGVTDGSGVNLIGGTNGIDIAFAAGGSPDTATFNLDTTEMTGGVFDEPVWYVEDYGSDLAGILAALAACDASADASASKPGVVMLPRGSTTIDLSSGGPYASPVIDMPETFTPSSAPAFPSCQLVGWGMAPDQAFADSTSGSWLWFKFPDANITPDSSGRRVLIEFEGTGQTFRDFGVGMSGTTSTDVDDTTMLFARSSVRTGCAATGECSIKSWLLERTYWVSAYPPSGVGFESIFALNGTIRDSWFRGFTAAYLPTSQASTANNANELHGNRFASNTVAVDVVGGLSCQDFYAHNNTFEGNAYGVRLRSGSTCRVYSAQNHWEQDKDLTPAGVNDVLIENANANFISVGDFFDSDLTGGGDNIVRTVAQGAGKNPDVLMGANFRDNTAAHYTYAAGADIQMNEDFRLTNFGVPVTTDCTVAPYTDSDNRLCWDEADDDLYVDGVQVNGGGGGISYADAAAGALAGF